MRNSCISGNAKHSFNNERGSALLVALILLVAMSILGTVLMSSTSTEQNLSGNYLSRQESFYAADRTIGYALQNITTETGTVDLYNDNDSDGTAHRSYLELNNSGIEDPDLSPEENANQVVYLSTGEPATESGMEANSFQARNYIVTAAGVFPLNAKYPSRTVLRAHFQKIIPKNDDTTF